MEESDKDLKHTALREAKEEMGLEASQVEIVTQMIPRLLMNGTVVVPFIGIVPETFEPTINPAEVQAAFQIPLIRFLSAYNQKTSTFNDEGSKFMVPYFTDVIDDNTYKTYGITALMAMHLAIIVFQDKPDFEWDCGGIDTIENPFKAQIEYLDRKLVPVDTAEIEGKTSISKM